MIGLDTNVLVRYLAQDDAVQAAKATKLIEGKLTKASPGYINHITLVETLWVLDSCYAVAKKDISVIVERIIATKQLYVQDVELVLRALRTFQSSNADFADALIGHLNHAVGCDKTYTFDKKSAKLDLFEGL